MRAPAYRGCWLSAGLVRRAGVLAAGRAPQGAVLSAPAGLGSVPSAWTADLS